MVVGSLSISSIHWFFSQGQYDGPVIQILVAVVKYKTRLSTPRLGLASNWLASLTGKVVVAIKPPTLRFPQVKKSLICVELVALMMRIILSSIITNLCLPE